MVFGSAPCGAHGQNGIKFNVGDGFPVPNALQEAKFFYSVTVTQYLCDRFSPHPPQAVLLILKGEGVSDKKTAGCIISPFDVTVKILQGQCGVFCSCGEVSARCCRLL